MVSRIQNRNTGYSDSLFSQNKRVDSNAIGSIDGATALKLDENYEVNEEQNSVINDFENKFENHQSDNALANEGTIKDIPSGVSIESASYVENNISNLEESISNTDETSNEIIEEYTPKLFSEEQSFQESDPEETNETIKNEPEQLFDQDINEEEDFEIPAFLRKQKF
jgi:hypothetical protein